MRSLKLMFALLVVIPLVFGCASAGKRLEQGSELEARGQYENAVMRYVQALEKDPHLTAARSRLVETGNLAITEQVAEADAWASRGDPVSSAAHYRRADNVVARARSVGVQLLLPADYRSQRRVVFDDAIDVLIDRGITAREQGHWHDGMTAYRQVHQAYEPTVDQRNRALVEEANLYLDWGTVEYERGHLRAAFDAAARVPGLEWCPATQAGLAAALMDDCLDEGEVELIVLPVQAKSGSKRQAVRDRELADQVESTLWRGPLRQPPAFVSMHDPLVARDLMSHAGILDGEFDAATLALILRLADADYGAHLQLLSTDATEFDVRAETRSVKTRAGKQTTFIEEKGKRRIQATARVVIADGYGNQISDMIVSGSGTAPFARGVYDGNARDLNLTSRQVDLFNRIALAEQEKVAREALVADLAASIAGAVFEPTLGQIP